MPDRKSDEARARRERLLDEALKETFPASDPVSIQLAIRGAQGRHHVVIVGGGFGGLEAVNGLAGSPVSITLINQRNYHLFQPLLYQVATASLATSEIAWPIRYLVRNRPAVTTMLATVVGVDAGERRVLLDDGRSLPYDTLILATGARHSYFGHEEWEAFAPGLKTLEDATTVRRRVLLAFERAEASPYHLPD
jgi:NADH:ubiquinone reductase (H+-translocating)